MVDMRRALQRDLGWNPDFKFLFPLMRKEGVIKIGVLLIGILDGGGLGRFMLLSQGTERNRGLRGLKGGHKVRDMQRLRMSGPRPISEEKGRGKKLRPRRDQSAKLRLGDQEKSF
jgi:hypothetical protein